MLNEIEIVVLTETWLDTKTLSENFTLFGQFEVVTRVDRPDGQHGGVVVLRRKISNVTTKEIIVNLDQFFGVCFVVENSSQALVFICVYLPPKTSDYRVLPHLLQLFMENCILKTNELYSNVTYFLVGDLNLPSCNWHSMTCSCQKEQEVMDVFCNFSLEPLIHNTPTHQLGNT